MKRICKPLAGIVLTAGLIAVAHAQSAKPEEAIAYRKAVMTVIGHHFGLMAAVVKDQQPYNRDAFATNATLVETFSKLPWEAFLVPGSDKGDTKLQPEAFKEQARFKADGKAFEDQAVKLVAAAGSGDLEAIKTQFGELAKSCQECHRQFRAR